MYPVSHYGNPPRKAIFKATKYAKESGLKVSFNPTLRFDVWALKYGLEIVGIKMDAKGAYLKTREGLEIYERAFKVRSMDTIGAGDGWNAGLLVGLFT